MLTVSTCTVSTANRAIYNLNPRGLSLEGVIKSRIATIVSNYPSKE